MSVPTKPIGHPDVLWGMPGQGGLLTEWAETVPDLTWPESVRTYGRMRRDGRLAAILKAFTLPIIRSTWSVDPAGCRAEAAQLIADDLGLPVLGEKAAPKSSPVRGFSWIDHVRLALNYLTYGHMPFEQWYAITGGRTHLAGLQERQPHTVSIIDVNEDTGYVDQVYQNTQDKPITANRLCWYANEREGANWTGVSLLRPCYTAWVLKHETLRVHATSIRRFGMGVPNVEAPPGATPAQLAQAQQLAAGMRVGDTAGAGLPSGFKLNLTGLTGSVPDAVAFLQFLNQEMTGSALAQIVELAHSTYGSRGVGESFLDLFLLGLQAVADHVADTITFGTPAMPGVARSLTEYNWGEGEPIPRITCGDVGDRHEITAAAIGALVTAGAITYDPKLEAFMRDAYGLPERTPDFPLPQPKGAPPPRPGGGGGTPAPAPAPDQAQPGQGHESRTTDTAAAGVPRYRAMTPVEAAAGLDPEAIRAELESARDGLIGEWVPVLAAQRQDLAEQVAAAVDGGDIAGLAQLAPAESGGTELLFAAMWRVANRAASRMIGEAAAQGITIDPKAVRLDRDRIRQVAQARTAVAGQAVAQAASRKALQVVQASKGTDAAREVTATLAGMSTVSLADQLLAAMNAASNEGRFAVMDAGPGAVYTATEINDANCCAPCHQEDGHQFAGLADARAAYPNGAYAGCLGELRCRGTVIATWPDART